MKKTKKIISALLAVVMLLSAFAVGSFAGAPEVSGSYKVNVGYELCDESGNPITTVQPGQTVYLYAYSNSSVANDELVNFLHSIYYDDEVYTYVVGSVEWLGVKDWIDTVQTMVNVFNESSTNAPYVKSAAAWTEAEKTAHPKWASFLYITGTPADGGTPYMVQENADKPMYKLTFTVNENVAPGTNADFGCPESVNSIGRYTYQNVRTANTGTIGKGEVQPTETYSVTVASEETAVINPFKTQIRWGKGEDGNYNDKFDIRTLAKISKADFDALFTDETNAKQVISDIGFVYAIKSDVASFDTTAAQALVKGEATPEGYKKVAVNYISTAFAAQNAGADYVISCIITNIPDADKVDGVYAMAYIAYDIGNGTEYAFFKTTDTMDVTFQTLYDQYADKKPTA